MKKLFVLMSLCVMICFVASAQTIANTETDHTIPAWIVSITGFLLLLGQFLITNKWVNLTKYLSIALEFLKKILVWITYIIDFITRLLNAVPNKGDIPVDK